MINDMINKMDNGRSSSPLFKHVSVDSPCGGRNGDGSLQEECEEEPTGHKKRNLVNDEIPWASRDLP